MLEWLLAAAALTIGDPVGDVVGAGDLQPPTSAVYRNLAPFDLQQVAIADGPDLTLVIELGSLADPFELPLGFSLPVIEVYLDSEPGGEEQLLPGSGMSLPAGSGWEYAFRLTGEEAVAYQADTNGPTALTPEVDVDGSTLYVYTPYPRPQRSRIHAMTGLYDLFGATPWRPLERTDSPWAFSSSSQRYPVVDVLAPDAAAQAQALDTGVLPATGGRASVPGSLWLVLMAAGLGVSLVGIAMRVVARRKKADTAEPERPAAAPEPAPAPHERPEYPGQRPLDRDSRGAGASAAAEQSAAAGGPAADDRHTADAEAPTEGSALPAVDAAETPSDGAATEAGEESEPAGVAAAERVSTAARVPTERTEPRPSGEPAEDEKSPSEGASPEDEELSSDGASPDNGESPSDAEVPEDEVSPSAAASSKVSSGERGAPAARRPAPGRFVWDSSALLSEPQDEDDGFAEEFRPQRPSREAGWRRPVPLTGERASGKVEPERDRAGDDDDSIEVLGEDDEDEADRE